MRKISAIFLCCALTVGSFGWCVSACDETVSSGSIPVRAEIQKGLLTASGYHAEKAYIQDGVLWLERREQDGLARAVGSFSIKAAGLLKFSISVCASFTDGNLFFVYGEKETEGVSLLLKSGELYLLSGGTMYKAGEFQKDKWYDFVLEFDYESRTVGLLENDIKIAEAPFSGTSLDCFEALLDNACVGRLGITEPTLSYGAEENVVYNDIDTSGAKDAILQVTRSGYLQGEGNGRFNPFGNITRAQMAQIVCNLLKLNMAPYEGLFSDVSREKWFASAAEAVCREEIMVGADSCFRPDDLLNLEETVKIFTVLHKKFYGELQSDRYNKVDFEYISSQTADITTLVKRDADTLKKMMPQTEYLFKNMALPSKGSFGSDITWKVENGNILEDNILSFVRTESADNELRLTATVSQGDVKESMDFSYRIYPCGVDWQSIADLNDKGSLLVPTTQKQVSFTFDITPDTEKMNALIGYTDRDNVVTTFQQMPIIVRLNEDGYFDCYNGNAYTADKRVKYTAGNRYIFRVNIDFVKQEYSVFVKQHGGNEIQIAENYAFRSSAASTKSIGRCYLRFGSGKESVFHVSFHSLAAPEEVTDNALYPFDPNYLSDGSIENDPIAALQERHFLKGDIVLPQYDAQGNELVWFSSHPILTDSGKLNVAYAEDGTRVALFSIAKGADPIMSAIAVQKDKISAWAIPYFLEASDSGLVRGILTRDSFDARQPVSREYGAILMKRLTEKNTEAKKR